MHFMKLIDNLMIFVTNMRERERERERLIVGQQVSQSHYPKIPTNVMKFQTLICHISFCQAIRFGGLAAGVGDYT